MSCTCLGAYSLDRMESEAFWARQAGNSRLINYINAPWETPWGIIVNDQGRQILVYRPVIVPYPNASKPEMEDATLSDSNPPRLSDITENTTLIEEVQKAPYKSPDDVGFWENLYNQIDSIFGSAAHLLKWGSIALVGYVLLQGWKAIK